jgi:hypothetical protein
MKSAVTVVGPFTVMLKTGDVDTIAEPTCQPANIAGGFGTAVRRTVDPGASQVGVEGSGVTVPGTLVQYTGSQAVEILVVSRYSVEKLAVYLVLLTLATT